MSEYPVNSTAKQYHDCDGNPITLYRLVRSEPDWAVSRIKTGEVALSQREELLTAIEKILALPNLSGGHTVRSSTRSERLEEILAYEILHETIAKCKAALK